MFLRAGYEVVLFDTQMSQLKTAQGYISSELEKMQKEGGCDASELIKKLTLTENLKEAMDGTIYVQVRCHINLNMFCNLYHSNTMACTHTW